MIMQSPAIEACGLRKRFGVLTAVDGLSFEVYPGEVFGLVGPDGAGKTTTLRMLAGILDPDEGAAAVAGFDTRTQSDGVKRHTAYMSQRFGLYPDLTVAENIDFYADMYGVPKKGRAARVDELLDFSYMRPFKTRLAGALSGGMKQKLQLVCALVHTPNVLLLDEPTNGVDPVSRRDFWRILYQLLKQNVAILVSTAYLDEAERCGRVGLLNQGGLLARAARELRSLMRRSLIVFRSSARGNWLGRCAGNFPAPPWTCSAHRCTWRPMTSRKRAGTRSRPLPLPVWTRRISGSRPHPWRMCSWLCWARTEHPKPLMEPFPKPLLTPRLP